jgi:hypothetical protein
MSGSAVPAVFLLLLAGSSAALATSWFDDDRQALPCRPTIACTADIVPPGSFELEIGYLFRKLRKVATQRIRSCPTQARMVTG